MKPYTLLSVAVLALVTGCATVDVSKVREIPTQAVVSFGAGTALHTIEVGKVVFALNAGEPYGRLGMGLLCLPGPVLRWDGGTTTTVEGPIIDRIRTVLKSTGAVVTGDPSQLFQSSDNIGELVLAGRVEAVELATCGENTFARKGSAYVSVEWQILSRSKNTVVMRERVEGSFAVKEFSATRDTLFITNAIEASVKNLVAHPKFREALSRADDRKSKA